MDAGRSTPGERRAIRLKRRGNAFGFWFFGAVVRWCGLKAAYLMVDLVVMHYLIFDREAVSAALAYIARRFPGAGTIGRYRHVRRLFASQGRHLVDRYLLARKPDYFKCHQVDTKETLEAIQDSEKGVVLLTSHVGNWQTALMHMGHVKKDIAVVMRPEDNPAVRASLMVGQRAAKAVQIIDPQSYLGGVIDITNALGKGQIVCMMGDRSYGFDTLTISFLGETAHFPYGPFWVAAATECPVIALLTYKIAEREYIADISYMWRPKCVAGRDRKDQLRPWLREYAVLLEGYVQEHPYDCFLFYDVWAPSKGGERWRHAKTTS